MTAVVPPEPERWGLEARRLRLNTLIRLRWLAVAGQTAAVLVGIFGFGLGALAIACFALIAASAALNLALRRFYPLSTQLGEPVATVILGYDILQLAGLLFLTGGVANPFVMFLLAPVTVAAASLTFRRALGLLLLALVCATLLLRFNLPLPWPGGETLVLPPLYLVGVWASLGVSAAFVALYAYRVAAESRQTASALTAVELVMARAQHLSQLDGLAAAAAHELGTPLATVALVVREMAAVAPRDEAFADDLHLLEESVNRCRDILRKLSSPAELGGQAMDVSSPVELAELAASPHRLLGVSITVARRGNRSAAAMFAQPRGSLRARQSYRERGQFRRVSGGDPGAMDEIDGDHRHLRRRPRVSAGRAAADRRALPVAAGRGAALGENRRRSRARTVRRSVAARALPSDPAVRKRGAAVDRRDHNC